MADTPLIYDPLSLPPGKKIIFRAWRIDPVTGERLYAKQYGYKAWPIVVDVDS